jgi:Ca-activated chloride channel family protein
MAEIYGSAKDDIFPSAEARIKDHNYNRINYNNHKWKLFLFISGLFCLILSAAGPQIGTKVRKVERQGVDLVIAFDTSISMDAQDIKPSRIEKAKFEISKLIQSLRGDRVSMIVFAGTSHLYLPLTTDYDAALLFLHAIDTKMIPNQGTSISSAMKQAIDLVSKDEDKYKVVLLVTDGEDHEGDAITLAKKASSMSIAIHTIGIGSNTGSLIPIISQNGNQIEYKRDKSGKLITSVLNQNILREIASAGNGKYFHFSNDGQTYNDVNKAIDSMEKRAINSHEYSEYEDRYQPLAFVSFLLFSISFVLPTRIRDIIND